MIKINLVPPQLRKKENLGGMGIWEAIDLPKDVFLGAGSLVILLLIFIHVLLIGAWVIQGVQHIGYKIVWQRMLPDKNNIDTINQELKDLRAKMSTINDITSKKAILWSQKLNVLSNELPKGVWLKKISWNNNVLNIEGSAVSRFNDEISVVGNFVSNLKKEDSFMKDFSSLDLNSVNRTKKGVTEVADFIITAKLK